MNSVVKQHPRKRSWITSRVALLAGLLAGLPVFGQAVFEASKSTVFKDATADPGNPALTKPGTSDPYGTANVITVPDTYQSRPVRGSVQKIQVVLPSLSHSYLADLDILFKAAVPLAGLGVNDVPTVVLMSDVGINQSTASNPVTITFDAGGSTLPASTDDGLVNANQSYKPTNNDQFGEAGDSFPDSAVGAEVLVPTPLGDIKNFDAKGKKFYLYGIDDRRNDSGQMAPWRVLVWFDPIIGMTNETEIAGATTSTINMVEDEPYYQPITITDTDTAASVFDGANAIKIEVPDEALFDKDAFPGDSAGGWRAMTGAQAWAERGLTGTPPADTWYVKLIPKPNQFNAAGTTLTVRVDDGTRSVTKKILAKVAPKNDRPKIDKFEAPNADNVLAVSTIVKSVQGGVSPINRVTVSDVDPGDVDTLKAQMTVTENTSLLAGHDVFMKAQAGAAKEIVFAPLGAATGTAKFNLFVKDSSDAVSDAQALELQVSKATDRSVFANSAGVTLADNAAAASVIDIAVSGLTGAKLTRAEVTLANLNHAAPDDLAVVLKSPGDAGKKITLMRGAGGANAVVGGRITFTTAAGAAEIPDNAALATLIQGNSYLPKDWVGGNVGRGVPDAAVDTLASLEDIDPNGTWKVYLVDTVAGTAGELKSGVILSLFTKPVVSIAGLPSDNIVKFNEDGAEQQFTVTSTDFDGTINSVIIDAANTSAKVTATIDNVGTAAGSIVRTLKIKPNTHEFGTGKVTVKVTDNTTRFTNLEVNFAITAENDQPSITAINKEAGFFGQQIGPIKFQVNDVETAPGSLVVQALANDPKILPQANIVLGVDGTDVTGKTRTVTLFPLPGDISVDQASRKPVEVVLTVSDSGQKKDTTGVSPDAGTVLSRQTTLRLDILGRDGKPSPQGYGLGITIPSNGAGGGKAKATLYPSTIDLTGKGHKNIRRMSVQLVDVDAPVPQDLDIILVGPDNRAVKLFADVGGAAALDSAQLIFKDDASSFLPLAGPITSGIFKPTDGVPGDDDSPPDVAAFTYFDTFEAAFKGRNPNVAWRLYAVDDTGNDATQKANIGSWILTLETEPSLAAIGAKSTPEERALDIPLNFGDAQPGVPISVEVLDGGAPLPGGAVLASATYDAVSGNLNIVPKTNVPATGDKIVSTIKVTVTLGVGLADPASSNNEFALTVTQVNDKPVVTGLANVTVPAGTIAGPFKFTISDVETAAADLSLAVQTSDNSLVPPGNVIVAADPDFPGDASKKILTILPNRSIAVSGVNIDVILTDKETSAGAKDVETSDPTKGGRIVYNAVGLGGIVFDNRNALAIPDGNLNSPAVSSINVSGVKGNVGKVGVALFGLTHQNPDDLHVAVVSPGGAKKVILMSNAGGAAVNAISGVTLQFTNAAPLLPDDGKIRTGLFQPSRFLPENINLGGLGLNGSLSLNLNDFQGIDPNGEWKLYVYDDQFPEDGQLVNGWALIFETAPTVADPGTVPMVEDTVKEFDVTLLDSDSEGTPANITLTVQSLTPAKVANDATGVSLTGTGITRKLKVTPVLNANGEATIRLTATDNKGYTSNRDFKVNIVAVNDAPVIAEVSGLVAPIKKSVDETVEDFDDTVAQPEISVDFSVSDIDSETKIENVLLSTSDGTIVPGSTPYLTRTGPATVAAGAPGIYNVKARPATNQFGTVTLTLTVKDGGNTVSTNLIFEIKAKNDLPKILSAATGLPSKDAIKGLDTPGLTDAQKANFTVFAGQAFPEITFGVSDIETPVKQLKVVATSGAGMQSVIPDSLMTVVANEAQRVLSIRTIGSVGSGGEVPISLYVEDADGGKSLIETFNVLVKPAPGTEDTNARSFTSDPGVITIGDRASGGAPAKASPYGTGVASIPVAGLKGKIHKVFVRLEGLTHESPDDLDIILEAPNGDKAVLMSDAGGTGPISNLTLEFNDGGTDLRDDGPIGSGKYKIRNFSETPDEWVDVTPGNFNSLEEAFKADAPNGTWKLYILDDANRGAGTLTRWTLRLVTTPFITLGAAGLVFNEDLDPAGGNSTTIEFGDSDAASGTSTYKIAIASSRPDIIDASGVVIPAIPGAGLGAAGALTITPVANKANTSSADDKVNVTLTITRDVPAGESVPTFSVTIPAKVNARNDDPVISRLNPRDVADGETIIVPVQITDPDDAIVKLEVTVAGFAGKLENSDIKINGGSNVADVQTGSTINVAITPKRGSTDSGSYSPVLTFKATDKSTIDNHTGGDRIGENTLTLNVVPKNDPPVITPVSLADAGFVSGVTRTFGFKFNDPDDSRGFKVQVTAEPQDLVKNSSIVVTPPHAACANTTDALPGGTACDGDSATWNISVTPEINKTGPVTLTIVVTDSGTPNATSTAEKVNIQVTPTRVRKFANKDGKITLNDFGSAASDVGRASPYPSIIDTSVKDATNDALVGDVAEVRVELTGLKHSYPDDIDMILEAPNGARVLLMSDVGGSTKADGVNLIISSAAGTAAFDDAGALTSGTRAPTDFEVGDTMPAPSGASSSISLAGMSKDLNSLVGTKAGGQWKLYAVDDTRGDFGEIAGWALLISTKPRMEFVGASTQTVVEDTRVTVAVKLVEEPTVGTTGYDFTFGTSNAGLVPSANVTSVPVPAGVDATHAFLVTPVKDASGEVEITINAKNKPFAQTVSGKFKLTYTPENDLPFITTTVADTTQTVVSGTLNPAIAFDYGDVETPKKDLVFEKISSNPSVLPISALIVEGNTLRIGPPGNVQGKSDITLRVSEPGAPARSAEVKFTVVVTPALNTQVAASSEISIPAAGPAGTYPSTINVSGFKGTTSRVSVTLAGVSHVYPADLDILLVGPNNKGAVLLSDIGGGQSINGVWLTIEDGAAALPVNPLTPITSGSYKPTDNADGVDTFPSDGKGGPVAGPYAADLSVFKNIDPNGEWKLYIVDDLSPDGGKILSGWTLNIFSASPVLSTIDSQSVLENGSVEVTFNVNDDDTALASVKTTASTPADGILNVGAVTGTGSQRKVVITPKPFLNGRGEVTITADDQTGKTAVVTFAVNVEPVNQAPEITGLPAKLLVNANRAKSAKFNVADQESGAGTLISSAKVLDESFGKAEVSGDGSVRTLTFTPSKEGKQGTVKVEIEVSDGVASTKALLDVEIGAPYVLTIPRIGDPTLTEDTARSVVVAVEGSETGKIAVQAVSSDSTKLGVVASGTGSAWLLDLTPARDANGSASVTVTATDDVGGVGTMTFDVLIEPVDDAPVFAAIPDQVTLKNIKALVRLNISDVDTAKTSLRFTSASSNPSLVKNVVFGLGNGDEVIATVFPAVDAVGEASLTITVDDGTTKVSRPFLFRVQLPPNVAPVFGAVPDQETTVNIPLVVPLSITDPDTELSKMVFTSQNSNSSIVRSILFGLSGTTVNATIRPQPNATGTAAVTINVQDGENRVSRTFLFTVKQAPNEAPVVGPISDQTTTQNKSVEVAVVVTDSDTDPVDLTLGAVASNPFLVDITVTKTATGATLTLAPKLDATGVSTITFSVNDGRTTVERAFSLGVTEAPAPKFERPAVTTNPDGSRSITITWGNGGELEVADSPNGPWVKTGNRSGSFTGSASSGFKFYRIVRGGQ